MDDTTYDKRREEADNAERTEVEALEAERESFGSIICCLLDSDE